jgi:anaerobic carbon-monoxide dehydrogenase iron sulfur subunit
MKIIIDREKCSGCHLCEMVCSLSRLGVINPEKSAIRVEKDDLTTSLNAPVLCRQCGKMACLQGEEANPAEERKGFLWDRARSGRCPFNALPVLGDKAFHCNLCNGKPQCVKVCTPGALTIAK